MSRLCLLSNYYSISTVPKTTAAGLGQQLHAGNKGLKGLSFFLQKQSLLITKLPVPPPQLPLHKRLPSRSIRTTKSYVLQGMSLGHGDSPPTIDTVGNVFVINQACNCKHARYSQDGCTPFANCTAVLHYWSPHTICEIHIQLIPDFNFVQRLLSLRFPSNQFQLSSLTLIF